jgi:hypothetical protein
MAGGGGPQRGALTVPKPGSGIIDDAVEEQGEQCPFLFLDRDEPFRDSGVDSEFGCPGEPVSFFAVQLHPHVDRSSAFGAAPARTALDDFGHTERDRFLIEAGDDPCDPGDGPGGSVDFVE